MEHDHVSVLNDWPRPAVVTHLRVRADDDHSLSILYQTEQGESIIVRFPWCDHVIFGEPNDEALEGHPLYGRGLDWFQVHQVHNSSLIASLERRNAVHPNHGRDWYLRDKKHYVFTFKERTIECVVSENERWQPQVKVFPTPQAADADWRRHGGA